ncbi:hypothetical protein AB0M54_35345 [Actinoplanes sp. NPDC051470]|uniref:hypothetical protein n=1 Tax=Actinoplanes sp. NPDC051470 TaxID=3157224 RepID=UPI00342D51C2
MTHARRKQAIVGIVGLAALGAGAYVATDQLAGDDPTVTSLPPASSAAAPSPSSPGPSPVTTTPANSAATAPSSPSMPPTSASPTARTTADRVKAARAKPGVKIKRPLPQSPADRSVTAADVTETRVVKGRQSLRVLSARKNLAGYRELGWVADDGEPVGAARCSQTFRFSVDMKPAEKPALLVCWRTSAGQSVYTVATNAAGRPSKQASVAAIEKQWKNLV